MHAESGIRTSERRPENMQPEGSEQEHKMGIVVARSLFRRCT